VTPEAPSEHWLRRLDAGAWLRAAEAELAEGHTHVAMRRTAVTHARRAAGMAINAVLVNLAPGDELRWGRSYLDHLRALASAEPDQLAPLPPETRDLANRLLAISVVPTAIQLVQLTRTPHGVALKALELAAALRDRCAATLARDG
jgi:hypothetical protein